MHHRPFRAPHHTISEVAMVGGGSIPRPGEISLAHNGVLFLDELPEFDRRVLEALRQPLEEGRVTIARVGAHLVLPCSIHARRRDESVPVRVSRRSAARMPLLGSADSALCEPDFRTASRSDRPRRRGAGDWLERARRSHCERSRHVGGYPRAGRGGADSGSRRDSASASQRLNRQLEGGELNEYCRLDARSTHVLEAAIQKFCLSARGCDRVLRVSRTIADLAGSDPLPPSMWPRRFSTDSASLRPVFAIPKLLVTFRR